MRPVGMVSALGVAAIALAGCGGTSTKTVVTVESHTTTLTRTVTTTVTGPATSSTTTASLVGTLGDFVAQPVNTREQIAIRILTTHPDKCEGGLPTPLGVATNIAPELAQFRPGKDTATGKVIPASTPIVEALAFARAEIGC